jgi:sulfite exporter TauE/SafE
MDNLLVIAFFTGLTSGGLSCLAVQGGLVTSSIAQRIEEEIKNNVQPRRKIQQPVKRGLPVAQPIFFFLLAKLVIHTLLGFLLGGIGSILTLTPIVRGILQMCIGLFMIGNALRMLNVHPIFRYFSFEPPSFITRFIRKASRNQSSKVLTPVFLGALTVLIPCGITQAMMATAVGTGSPLLGAMLMFAYVLGTGPVFFAVTYLATKLGSLWEKQLLRLTAVVILVIGLLAVDTGLNLTGSPVSLSRLFTSVTDAFSAPAGAESQLDPSNTRPTLAVYDPNGAAPSVIDPNTAKDTPTDAPNVILINVKNTGYLPAKITARAGQALKLKLVTKGVYSCSRAFTIPGLNIEKLLPATGEEMLDIPAQQAGTSLQFSCSMGMYTGTILFQ